MKKLEERRTSATSMEHSKCDVPSLDSCIIALYGFFKAYSRGSAVPQPSLLIFRTKLNIIIYDFTLNIQ